MTTITKKITSVEMHCIEHKYNHLRVHSDNARIKIATSIEQHGQLVPVIMVANSANKIVLIDGHLRLQALRRLGKDTVEAEVWECCESEALLMVLRSHSGRALDALEQALVLRELHAQHGLSHEAIAERIGRDRSWVSRRLSLLDFISDDALKALSSGAISIWSATRVLAPVARATPEHAQSLLQYLQKNEHNTRNLQSFYEHYQRANRKERTNMINNPDIFFKAQKIISADKEASKLKDGPEGKWKHKLRIVSALLHELLGLVPSIFYLQQQPDERNELQARFNKVKIQLNELSAEVEKFTDVR